MLTSAVTPAPVAPAPAAVDQRSLQQVVDDFRVAKALPGVTVAILHDGHMTSLASGVADVATGAKLTADDPMYIASASKTFTAGLAMRLVQEGRLALDATIDRWLPTLPNAGSITVRQLLGHRSGLANVLETKPFGDALAADRPMSHAQLLDAAAGAAPHFAPGARWEYSNTNYVALASILEQVTGQPLATALRERVLHPLGLDGVLVDSGDAPAPTPVTGYWHGWDGAGPREPTDGFYRPGGTWRTTAWGDAGIVASAPQLARWGHELVEGHRLLDAGTRAEMQRGALGPLPADPNELPDGLGLFGGAPVVDGHATSLWHNGLDLGYSSMLVDLPSEHTTVAVLANQRWVGMADWSDLLNELVGRVEAGDAQGASTSNATVAE